jgi:tRNA (guanine-N7-)-methyltransferase
LFFPDPWHKKKHHKRRLVQTKFVQLIHQKLVCGGTFHIATDWQPYAEHIMAVMETVQGYSNVAGPGQFSPQPDYRPITRFQERGVSKGFKVWDLIYKSVLPINQKS